MMLSSLSPNFGICWPCWGVSEDLCYPQTEPKLKPTGKDPQTLAESLFLPEPRQNPDVRAQKPRAGRAPIAQRQTKATGTTVSLSPCLSLIVRPAIHGNKIALHWELWHTPVIPALRRQRQENHMFQASLGYVTS